MILFESSSSIRSYASDILADQQYSVKIQLALERSKLLSVQCCIVLNCGRVPAANAPGCTAAECLLYKPWSLVVPTCTARCLHQRP